MVRQPKSFGDILVGDFAFKDIHTSLKFGIGADSVQPLVGQLGHIGQSGIG